MCINISNINAWYKWSEPEPETDILFRNFYHYFQYSMYFLYSDFPI